MALNKIPLVLILTSLITAGSAQAQDTPSVDRSEMTQEERQAAREARRAEFEGMTEDERAAAREQRLQDRRERLANMTDEERQALRENRSSSEGFRGGSRPQGSERDSSHRRRNR